MREKTLKQKIDEESEKNFTMRQLFRENYNKSIRAEYIAIIYGVGVTAVTFVKEPMTIFENWFSYVAWAILMVVAFQVMVTRKIFSQSALMSRERFTESEKSLVQRTNTQILIYVIMISFTVPLLGLNEKALSGFFNISGAMSVTNLVSLVLIIGVIAQTMNWNLIHEATGERETLIKVKEFREIIWTINKLIEENETNANEKEMKNKIEQTNQLLSRYKKEDPLTKEIVKENLEDLLIYFVRKINSKKTKKEEA